MSTLPSPTHAKGRPDPTDYNLYAQLRPNLAIVYIPCPLVIH